MSKSCLNCGGLIMEPNKTYGYGGPVCYCPVNPASLYQRPSMEQTYRNSQLSTPDAIVVNYSELKELLHNITILSRYEIGDVIDWHDFSNKMKSAETTIIKMLECK